MYGRIDESIKALSECTVFSTLDANNGSRLVEFDDRDKDENAFKSHHSLYRFIKTPFGLKNTPGRFQRAMDVIPSLVKWRIAQVYLDNIVMFSKTLEKHITHVKQVLTILQKTRITLKLWNCNFFTNKIH